MCSAIAVSHAPLYNYYRRDCHKTNSFVNDYINRKLGRLVGGVW